jgi:hypothetical protein
MGIVYMLCYENLFYIGSTIATINSRIKRHKNFYEYWLNGKTNYCSSFEIIKNENYELIIIEEIKNETEEECIEREQLWIDFYGKENLINKRNADGHNTIEYQKKYYIENKDKKKQYYLKNKDKILQYKKEYNLKNKEKI